MTNVISNKFSEKINKELKINFFTIVLNGQPFIRYHASLLASLPVDWHWHVVEGVASLSHDTAWSLRTGGAISESFHKAGLSIDGTSEYLDDLQKRFPTRVTIYRKTDARAWDGKREMCNAPLANIKERGLLWQVDADELWTREQLMSVHRLFLENPGKSAAYFWCHYFVGPQKIISTRNNYAQNPQQEWLRVWRFRPGDTWAAHEPPKLVRKKLIGRPVDVASIDPFLHAETEHVGAVFQHFSFVTVQQLEFKEKYYGYKDACKDWKRLQTHKGQGSLRDFMTWVKDETKFDDADNLKIKPLARLTDKTWSFE